MEAYLIFSSQKQSERYKLSAMQESLQTTQHTRLHAKLQQSTALLNAK